VWLATYSNYGKNRPRRLSFNGSTHYGRSRALAISGGVSARRRHHRQQNVCIRLPDVVRDARRAVNPAVSRVRTSSQFRKRLLFKQLATQFWVNKNVAGRQKRTFRAYAGGAPKYVAAHGYEGFSLA
jgi:hypothetical protein